MDHMDGRMQQARSMNDAVRPETETAVLRGRINELKALLALNNELPVADEPPR